MSRREREPLQGPAEDATRAEHGQRAAAPGPFGDGPACERCELTLAMLDELPALARRWDRKGLADYFNRSWLRFRGRTLEQETGTGWEEGVHPEDRNRVLAIYLSAFDERREFSMEYRLLRHDGTFRWMLDNGRPVLDREGRFAGYVGSCVDITERKEQERRLAYLATHDALTSLPNRRVLEEALGRAYAQVRRGVPSSLLMLDVDGFKDVNDSVGHGVGDHVLVTLSDVIKSGLRESDLVARVGGDEFAVLLVGTGLDEAEQIAQRICRAVAAYRFDGGGRRFDLGVSIGMARLVGSEEPFRALARADEAMYEAKAGGGGCVTRYSAPIVP